MTPVKSPDAATEFTERMGIAMEADGLPRIAGRLLGFLLVSGGPCSADDLSATLQISSGSVSTNTRLLERLGIVERVSFPGDRHIYYQLTRDPYGQLLQGHVERMRQMQAVAAEARQQLPASMREGAKRLAQLERFYSLATERIDELLTSWRSQSR